MAKLYANHYNKPITSGSDFHSVAQLAKGGIATSKKINSSAELVDALKSGDYRLIEKD